MKLRISRDITYEELQRLVELVSQKYDDVHLHVQPHENGFQAYLVVRTPDIEFKEAIRDCL